MRSEELTRDVLHAYERAITSAQAKLQAGEGENPAQVQADIVSMDAAIQVLRWVLGDSENIVSVRIREDYGFEIP